MYISVKQLAARFDVSVPTIWRWTKEGSFPQPVRLGPQSTRWIEEDVREWERARAAEAG